MDKSIITHNRVEGKLCRTAFLTGLILICLAASTFVHGQSVSINTTGAKPNVSSGLDVDFPDKGILIPRVALTGTSSALPLPAHVAGMVVFNTASVSDVTPGLYINDGTRWRSWSPPPATATGTMLYWNGSAWILIPPGTPGQRLRLNSSGIPTWI